MMDLALDSKQSKVLDCSTCDPSKMKIRNCENKYGQSKSPLIVNDTLYRACPRSVVADDWETGYLVSLYFDCKENKTIPFGQSLLDMTSFCKEAFDLMDGIVYKFRERMQKKHEEEMKKLNKK